MNGGQYKRGARPPVSPGAAFPLRFGPLYSCGQLFPLFFEVGCLVVESCGFHKLGRPPSLRFFGPLSLSLSSLCSLLSERCPNRPAVLSLLSFVVNGGQYKRGARPPVSPGAAFPLRFGPLYSCGQLFPLFFEVGCLVVESCGFHKLGRPPSLRFFGPLSLSLSSLCSLLSERCPNRPAVLSF